MEYWPVDYKNWRRFRYYFLTMVSTLIKPCRIVVLVSGSGSNLQAIIDECAAGNIQGKVVAVISNVAGAYALTRAAQYGIDSVVIDHKAFVDREMFDIALAKEVNRFSPDLVVLAGFMRILSPGFVSQFEHKMFNIHPSLLPKYPGLGTHQKAIENRDLSHGASVHFVNAELDGGPVVLQSLIKINENDTVESLQDRLAKTEWVIYPLAVKWFCQGALRIVKDKVRFGGNLDMSLLRSAGSVDCKIIINNTQDKQNDEDKR